jgi:MtN3 and saliva related transmembrane protein
VLKCQSIFHQEKNTAMTFIDMIIEFSFSLGLVINAGLFIPQIIQLRKAKSAKGLSLITFGGFCLIQFVTILHGYIKGDYLLVWGYGLSLLTCGMVTILILKYRRAEAEN